MLKESTDSPDLISKTNRQKNILLQVITIMLLSYLVI